MKTKTAPFNLQKALAGHPLITRDGRGVTGFKKRPQNDFRDGTLANYPFPADVESAPFTFTPTGEMDGVNKLGTDLFLKITPAKRSHKKKPATKPGSFRACRGIFKRDEIKQPENIGHDWTVPAVSIDTTVTAPGLLAKAADIMAERGRQYDSPQGERSMGKSVEAFNLLYGHKLTEADGWGFMGVLKTVRSRQHPGYHADSYEDKTAYSALEAEAKAKAAEQEGI